MDELDGDVTEYVDDGHTGTNFNRPAFQAMVEDGKGIETEPVRLDDYTGKKMTFFHDPDGLPLEIHE